MNGDIVTNLQYQIDQLRESIKFISTKIDMIAKGKAMATITVVGANGTRLSGLKIKGMADAEGAEVYTNTNGVATGLINSGSVTLSIDGGYVDMNSYSKNYPSVAASDVITDTWTLNFIDFKEWYSSANGIIFSPFCKQVDVALCGGGGGGGFPKTTSGSGATCTSGGGGGGYTTVQDNVPFESGKSYSVVVGAGGNDGYSINGNNANSYDGGTGGSSSFLGVSANGGSGGSGGTSSAGGSGNGRGGNGVSVSSLTSNTVGKLTGGAGGVGTGYVYSSFTATKDVGGGGGGGGACSNDSNTTSNSANGGTGGSPNGGAGGNANIDRGSVSGATGGSNGSTPGGGGGGGPVMYVRYHTNNTSQLLGWFTASASNGKGAGGIVTIRIHH